MRNLEILACTNSWQQPLIALCTITYRLAQKHGLYNFILNDVYTPHRQ